MRVAELAPHAGLSSNNVDTRIFRVELIDVSPLDVALVWFAVSVAEADIKICQVVVGEDDFISSVDQSVQISCETPPL